MNDSIKNRDCNIFHPVKNLEDLPKVAFLIRGHTRASLNSGNLNHFLLACSTMIDFDLYIQTWNVSEANKSWRDTSSFDFNKVEESDIYDYFDKSLHPRIKKVLVLDESSIELSGNVEGFIGKTKCPTVGWKYMWGGMYQNISQVPEDNDYAFAINTRFDILTEGLDNFCRLPQHTEDFIPRSHLDFIKQMVLLTSFKQFKFIYFLYDVIGCDNFIAGSVENIRFLIESFHFKLDEILPKWIDSNFRTKHQEACVRWFCKSNNIFRFTGIPNIDDQS